MLNIKDTIFYMKLHSCSSENPVSQKLLKKSIFSDCAADVCRRDWIIMADLAVEASCKAGLITNDCLYWRYVVYTLRWRYT